MRAWLIVEMKEKHSGCPVISGGDGNNGAMTWLLCDFGEVLSLPQDQQLVRTMAQLSGHGPQSFKAAYYRSRLDYDAARISAANYWGLIFGRDLDDQELSRMVEMDAASWLRPNPSSLEAVKRTRSRGLDLAILSNMPLELARVVESLEWTDIFHPKIFSCDLGLAKPEPEIYLSALSALGADPSEVYFLDDRSANVEAAAALGISAQLFVDPAQLDRVNE